MPLPDLTSFDRPLFLVGCGAMAGAMLSRWLECGLDPAKVTVLRPSGKPVADGVRVVTEYPDTLPERALVVLGVKPQQFAEVVPHLAALWRSDLVLVSLLAGMTSETIGRSLAASGTPAVVRIMSNLPVALGKGICAVHAGDTVDASTRDALTTLLTPLGLVEWMKDDSGFNLITALAGSGPAFLYRFIDAFAKAGEALGMAPDQSARLAMAMIEGASALAAASGQDPAALADRVASKGGTTRMGLDVLDRDNRLVDLVTETLRAARDRGEELSKLAN